MIKRFVSILVAVAIAAAVSIGVASPASAYTGPENKLWSLVKEFAPEGAAAIGKSMTIRTGRTNCKALRNGVSVTELVDIAVDSIIKNSMSDYEANVFTEWVGATLVASTYTLCKSQQWKMDTYLSAA